MVESAYTGASKASARKGLRVRVPLPAPLRGGVLAGIARRVGAHAGRGAEPPEPPTFRRVTLAPGSGPAAGDLAPSGQPGRGPGTPTVRPVTFGDPKPCSLSSLGRPLGPHGPSRHL